MGNGKFRGWDCGHQQSGTFDWSNLQEDTD